MLYCLLLYVRGFRKLTKNIQSQQNTSWERLSTAVPATPIAHPVNLANSVVQGKKRRRKIKSPLQQLVPEGYEC